MDLSRPTRDGVSFLGLDLADHGDLAPPIQSFSLRAGLLLAVFADEGDACVGKFDDALHRVELGHR